jgi:hypothetical protein
MAFTSRDYWRGAWEACAVFMLILIISLTVAAAFAGSATWALTLVILAVLFGGIPAVLITVIAGCALLPLSHALTGIAHPAVHIVTYAVVGFAVGLVGIGVRWLLLPYGGDVEPHVDSSIVIATTIAVPLGWLHSWKRARRRAQEEQPHLSGSLR